MSAEHLQAPDAPGFSLDRRVVVTFGRFAGGFWRGESARTAWALTLGLATVLLLSTATTVLGYGSTRYIVVPTINGAASWPRRWPVPRTSTGSSFVTLRRLMPSRAL